MATGRAGIASMFGQPRRLLTFAVLVVVLLVPAVPMLSAAVRDYVVTVVVTTLAVTVFVAPGRSSARFGLGWFIGATAVVLITSGGPWALWIWPVLLVLVLPLTALIAAAWSIGSWRDALRTIGHHWRRTWLGAIGTTFVFSIVVAILVGAPMLALQGVVGDDGDAIIIAIGTAISQTLLVAIAVGYANAAIDRQLEITNRAPEASDS